MVSGRNYFVDIGQWAFVSFTHTQHSIISVVHGEMASHTKLTQHFIIERLHLCETIASFMPITINQLAFTKSVYL